MNMITDHMETPASVAFTAQSAVFDDVYGNDTMIAYKRERVRKRVCDLLAPQSRILELNAGTGVDALYFASLGHQVHATDLSEGMQEVLKRKIETRRIGNISTERISFNDLDRLTDKGPYDLIFSNFAGLNCTGDLAAVVASFAPLLKPGGKVVLVLMPPFCLWETLLVFRGKFRTALRRLFSSAGRAARVEGKAFTCWYYSPEKVKRFAGENLEWLSLDGLCTIVPPSYIEHFADRYPLAFRLLAQLENRYGSSWPWRSVGDYYIISFRKKDAC